MKSVYVVVSGGISLSLRVAPGASQSGLNGVAEDRLRIRLCAPAIEGRANLALIEFLSRQLGLPKSCITITRGQKGRDKTVMLAGDSGLLAARLEALISGDRDI